MFKRLFTLVLSALLLAPLSWGQENNARNNDNASFAPSKGQIQFSLMLGGGNSFYSDNQTQLLPNYTSSGSIGLPNGNTDASGELGAVLNLTGFNDNSLVNILGIQVKYFVADLWAINLSAGLNIGITPHKNYVEPEYEELDLLSIPAQRYVNAQVNNNWYANIGFDRYFKTRYSRLHPYLGALVGIQMARIHTKEPYTGRYVIDEDMTQEGEPIDEAVYIAPGKIGQMMGFKGAAVAGIEYTIMPGLTLALECQPLAYRYDLIQIAPQGFETYNLCHHNIKIFEMPTLKIGFRF